MGTTGIRSLSLQCAWVSIVAFLVLGSSGHNDVGASNLKDGAKCVPSSCGDIHDISYPLRLQQDPEQCGDSRYTLECDHNNITVLRLFSQEYYVKAIDYDFNRIRVVDPGLEKNNCSSLPHFPLSPYNFSYHSWEPYNVPVIFLKCANPVNSSRYVSTAPCINSEMYGYAVPGNISTEDVENGCTVYWMSLTTWMPYEEDRNVSYQDIHDQMVYGFELRYSTSLVDPCRGQWNYPGLDTYSDRECYPRNIRGFFLIGWRLFTDYWATESIIAGSIVAAKLVFGGPFVIALLIHKWRRRHWSTYRTIEDFLHSDNFMPIRYSYSNIKKMSAGFKDKLGAGGYGFVFKCKLRSGRFGAIKLLGKSNANGEDFMSEVATIGRIHHVNVVQLVGYCVEGSKRALVYDFMPNGSLDRYIYSKEESIPLSYKKIYEIAVGVAQGIEYLHQGCEMQILHFDIKPHNILLDENFVPKISDFGLAKLYPANNSIVSSMAARGTMGYIAPELFYKNIGGVSYKADVYSFGMLLMEMASRRKNLNANVDHSSQIYFPSWVHDQYNEGKDLEIGDATAEEKKLIRKMIVAALWCIQMKPSDRPSMKRVTQMLVGDVENLEMPPKPSLCPQPTPVSNLIPACSNVELTCTLSAR
ncbi:PREDICTED: probable receptor-like protein kinase At5g39030 [Fragaria vesca subsp. vesca]|uniref:probable receptor-like protein kinase At5g39030 n=1 Tax=Fragaria vesca subsp. vesca TaxID=101020 RepID=UPI0002C3107C|nr:PREDICTED: probable receptor-like protein kinase At5g39030 [Fragaria vesca subsp. vesca]